MELKMNFLLFILFMAAKPYNQQPADEVQQIFDEISQGLKKPRHINPADKEEVVYEPRPPCSHMFRVYNIMDSDYEKNSCGVDPTAILHAHAAQGQRRRRMVGGIRGGPARARQKNLQWTKPWTVALVAAFVLPNPEGRAARGTAAVHMRRTTTGIIIHRRYVLVPTYGLPRGIKRTYANARTFNLRLLMGLPVMNNKGVLSLSKRSWFFDNIVDGDITYFDSGEVFNRDEAHLQFALIKLKLDILYTPTVKPVCIPAMPVLDTDEQKQHYIDLCKGPTHNDRAVAIGFGHNEHYAGEALLNKLPFVVEQRNEETGALLLRCQLDDQQPCGAAESDHGGPVLIERYVAANNQQPRQYAASMITYIHAPPDAAHNAGVLPRVIAVDLMTMAPWIAKVIKGTENQEQPQEPPHPPQQPPQPPQLAEPFQAGEPQAGPSHAEMPWEDDDDVEAEAPQAEAPQAEAPQAEAPQAEAPQAEAPQAGIWQPWKGGDDEAEAPQPEAPEAEASVAEAPEAEAPEAEAPEAGLWQPWKMPKEDDDDDGPPGKKKKY